MSITNVIIASLLIMLVTFAERLFPFVIFSNREAGKLIHIFEKYVPPIVMFGLLVYSLRGVRFTSPEMWVPHLSAIAFTIITYIWKSNTLVSIFGGTAIYMILIRVLY